MKLIPLQYMHYLVDLNFNEEMRLISAKDRVSIYLDRLVTKYNGVKSQTYWAIMLREIISIANELNISLIKAFELKQMTVEDVEDIPSDLITIEKAFLIDKEFFSTLYEMRTFFPVWKKEGGSLDTFASGLVTLVLLIVQGTRITIWQNNMPRNYNSNARATFSFYLTALRQEMANDIFHDIKHSNLCNGDRTYSSVWTWYEMRDRRVDIDEYESLYSSEDLARLKMWEDMNGH